MASTSGKVYGHDVVGASVVRLVYQNSHLSATNLVSLVEEELGLHFAPSTIKAILRGKYDHLLNDGKKSGSSSRKSSRAKQNYNNDYDDYDYNDYNGYDEFDDYGGGGSSFGDFGGGSSHRGSSRKSFSDSFGGGLPSINLPAIIGIGLGLYLLRNQFGALGQGVASFVVNLVPLIINLVLVVVAVLVVKNIVTGRSWSNISFGGGSRRRSNSGSFTPVGIVIFAVACYGGYRYVLLGMGSPLSGLLFVGIGLFMLMASRR